MTFDPSFDFIKSLHHRGNVLSRFRELLNRAGFGLVRDFFFLFPAIAALAVFGLDRWSYFRPDPFTTNFAPVGTGPFFWRSMKVFFACWIPLTVCCWWASRYSRATEKVVREYGETLRADLLARRARDV